MTSSEITIAPPHTVKVPSALRYRPDIDGMRAVAVIAVVLFHAFPVNYPSGFIGVDMFFVISGYLITGIILTGLSRGEFSFSGFYARRIRRIFPSLSLVLACCLALGWYMLTPREWHSLARNAVGGAGFISNLLQSPFNTYFDNVTLTPLLHLWSLAIEEQFYLVWPVTLFILWKLSGQKRKRSGTKMLASILLIAFASFLFDVRIVSGEPIRTFYNPFARAWELLAGAALACFTPMPGYGKGRATAELMSVAGAALVAAGLCFVNPGKPYPGWWTLAPVLGVVLLIGAGSEAWINRRVLALRPLVLIGLVSYPLYLWHWPLLVFFRLALRSDFTLCKAAEKLATIGLLQLAAFLSWLCYKYWEKPMRFSAKLAPAFRVRLLLACMAGLGVLAALSLHTIPPRLNSDAIKKLDFAMNDAHGLGNWHMQPLSVATIPSLSARSTLLVGDSHMEQYFPRAEAAIKANPNLASAVFATAGSCPPFPDMNPALPGFQCIAFHKYWMSLAREARFSTIAISAFWENYNTEPFRPEQIFQGHHATNRDFDQAWKGLTADLRTLVQAGKRVVIFSSSPVSVTFDPELGIPRIIPSGAGRMAGVSRSFIEESQRTVNLRLRGAAASSGAEFISVLDYFCRATECPAVDTDGSPIYHDNNHIRATKAAKLATFVDEVLRP